MKLCVFQGTFNPIHNAHLRMANYMASCHKFDKIIFIPAAKPPHKTYNQTYSIHRLNMVKLAVKKYPKFVVSDIEYIREGKSYTYETICELYKIYNPDEKIKFIIGTDAFREIETWYETDKLKQLVKFIVFVRDNDFNATEFNYLKEKGYDFEFETLPYQDISSTELREKIKNKEDISLYVEKEVREYIIKNELYKD